MDEDKTGVWAAIAAALALSLCCGLPVLVTAFGVGAVAAIAEYGLAGLAGAAVLGAMFYLLRRASRRRRRDSGAGCTAADSREPVAALQRDRRS